MKIEEIQEMWDKDCIIDDARLARESLAIPQIHNKYLKILLVERATCKRMQYEYNEAKFLKQLYYSNKLDAAVMTRMGWEPFNMLLSKNDIEIYMESDRDLTSKRTKVGYQEEKVTFLEEILKQLSVRNFIIKNAIDWNKFTNGAL